MRPNGEPVTATSPCTPPPTHHRILFKRDVTELSVEDPWRHIRHLDVCYKGQLTGALAVQTGVCLRRVGEPADPDPGGIVVWGQRFTGLDHSVSSLTYLYGARLMYFTAPGAVLKLKLLYVKT